MTVGRCPRQWEVEAIRDRRVVGAARQSFEAHLARCCVCRKHADALEACVQKLKELPGMWPDEFTARRQRLQLLEQFNASLLASPRRSLHAPVLILIGVFAAIVALACLRQHSVPGGLVEMRAASPGTWEEIRQGDSDRVELRDGHFDLVIHRPSTRHRVVLAVPDGEIEDLGTALEVWISNGQTNRVSVKSGEVVVRLRGCPTTHLRAGEHWARKEQAESAVSRSSLPLVVPDAASTGSASNASAPLAATRAVRARAGINATPSAKTVAPRVRRVTEDSAYLRVLDLFGQGRADQTKIAADAYLAEYPLGFRRPEILDIEQRLRQGGPSERAGPLHQHDRIPTVDASRTKFERLGL